MQLKKVLSLIFIFSVITIVAKAENDDSTIIWSEDFTGYYSMPDSCENAIYGGNKASLFDHVFAGGMEPEVGITKGGHFFAKIALFGASGKFTLSFNCNHPDCVDVRLNEKNYKKDMVTTFNYSGNKFSCSFDVAEQQKVLFLNINCTSNVRIDNIVLSAPKKCREERTSPTLSFSKEEGIVSLNGKENLPKLSNPYGLNVSYWSSDRSVAEITSDGKIIPKDYGETTIYAIYHGGTGRYGNYVEDEYSYQSVSYKLTVKRLASVDEVYYEDFSDIFGRGGINGRFDSSFGNMNDNVRLRNVTHDLQRGYKCSYFMEGVNDNSTYTLGSFGNKLSGKKCILSFKVAGTTKKCNRIINIEVKNGKNTIFKKNLDCEPAEWQEKSVSFDNLNIDKNSKIVFSGKGYYLDNVSLVAKDNIGAVNLNIGKYGYATLYYSDRSLLVPDGMSAYTMKVDGEYVVPSRVYKSGSTIPKGEAVLLEADEGQYLMNVSNIGGTKDPDNLLHGTDDIGWTVDDCKSYMFGVDMDTEEVGFFWGAEDGGCFINQQHKAYLAVPDDAGYVVASKAYAVDFSNFDYTSGIQTVIHDNVDRDNRTFNLSGQRVSNGYHGIVIKNGKKYVKLFKAKL